VLWVERGWLYNSVDFQSLKRLLSGTKIMATNPFDVLKAATKAVPAMKYAVAVAGVASVVAIVLGFKLRPQIAIFGALVVIGLMFVLAVFSSYVRRGTHALSGPATVLVWFYTLATMVGTTLFITGYFLHWFESFRPPDIGTQIPVHITAVYRNSLFPARHAMVIISRGGLDVEEVTTDKDGNADLQLSEGRYELQAAGENEKHPLLISPPDTKITIPITRQGNPKPEPPAHNEYVSLVVGYEGSTDVLRQHGLNGTPVPSPNNSYNKSGPCLNEAGRDHGICISRTYAKLTTTNPYVLKNPTAGCYGNGQNGCQFTKQGPASVSDDGLTATVSLDNWSVPVKVFAVADQFERITATSCGPPIQRSARKGTTVLFSIPKDCIALATLTWSLADGSQGALELRNDPPQNSGFSLVSSVEQNGNILRTYRVPQ